VANIKQINPLDIKETYFNSDGTPTIAGEMLINTINLLAARTGGPRGSLGVALKDYTVSTLPTTNEAGHLIYVTDESGGAVPAFSDSTGRWRRCTDRAIVS